MCPNRIVHIFHIFHIFLIAVVLIANPACSSSPSRQASSKQAPTKQATKLTAQVDELARQLGGKQPKNNWVGFNKLKALGKRAMPRLKELAEGKDRRLRLGAVRGLGAIAADAKVSALLGRLLRADDAEVRLSVLNTIKNAYRGHRGLIDPLKATTGDSDDRVGRLATTVLIEISRPKALAHFRAELTAKQPSNRRAAAEGLRQLGEEAKAALPRLVVALNDADSRVREAACKAVAAVGPKRPEAWAALGKVAVADAVPFVRIAAADALVACIDAAPQLVSKATVEVLGKVLDDRNYHVRGAALRGLASIGDRAVPVVAGIRHTLLKDGKHHNRTAAARILGDLPLPVASKAIPDLVAALSDSRETVGKAAAAALATLAKKSPKAAAALRRARRRK